METKSVVSKFFGKAATKSTMQDTITTILDLEDRVEAARAAVEMSKKRLQNKFREEALSGEAEGDHTSLATEVTQAQAKLDAMSDLLKERMSEAVQEAKLTAKGSAARKETAEQERKDLQRQRGVSVFGEVAKLAASYGLKITLPNRHNTGVLSIPTIDLSEEEMNEIITKSSAKQQPPDKFTEKLMALNAEIEELMMASHSSPDVWLNYLLSRARRFRSA